MPSQKILVVEDSLSQRMMISRHLRNWEYEVLEAADGVEAFTAFRQQSRDHHNGPRYAGNERLSAY